jgi:hypothetical protein
VGEIADDLIEQGLLGMIEDDDEDGFFTSKRRTAMSEKVKSIGYMHLSNVRFSYFYGFEPFIGKPTPQNPKPVPNFCVHGLMAPDHPDLKKVAATIEAVGSGHQWKNGITWAQVKESLKQTDKLCLHKGDVTKAGVAEYAGLYFISCNNKKRFTIVDADRTPLTAADGRPYSGCYGNIIVDIYAQDNQWGRRINATVTGVQFLRNGDAFGGGAPPADADEFGTYNAESADQAEPAGPVDPTGGLL